MVFFTTSAQAPLQLQADSCAHTGLSQQQPMCQSKASTRQKARVYGLIAFAFGGAGMFGFFIVGPLLKHATVVSETRSKNHLQGSGKFMIPQARPLSGPAHPGVTIPGDLAPPLAPMSAAHGSTNLAVMGSKSSQLSQLQAWVAERKDMLEEREAHESGNAMAIRDPPPSHSNTRWLGALLAFMGIAFGGAAMYAIIGSHDRVPTKSRLATVAMSAIDTPGRATELRSLLVDAVTAGATPDASRADALIQELADARVPFRAELLGSSASESAIVSSPASESPLWRACYSSGKTPRWERNAKVLGNLFNNRAGQAYDASAQRVCNYGEVLGKRCYFTAEGSFSPVDDARRCPKDFDVAIERGGFVVFGKPFVSNAISGPGYLRVLYLDEELRIFESPSDSPDRWEEAGLRVVQIRECTFG